MHQAMILSHLEWYVLIRLQQHMWKDWVFRLWGQCLCLMNIRGIIKPQLQFSV
jgi:hypothetical protein